MWEYLIQLKVLSWRSQPSPAAGSARLRTKSYSAECVGFVPERIGVHWGAFGFIFCKTMCITSLCILLCMH